eukprot:scaffold707_cov399-Prasinococcus_capsulatus_cf.AAC.14
MGNESSRVSASTPSDGGIQTVSPLTQEHSGAMSGLAAQDELLRRLRETRKLVPLVKRRQTISGEGHYLKDLFSVCPNVLRGTWALHSDRLTASSSTAQGAPQLHAPAAGIRYKRKTVIVSNDRAHNHEASEASSAASRNDESEEISDELLETFATEHTLTLYAHYTAESCTELWLCQKVSRQQESICGKIERIEAQAIQFVADVNECNVKMKAAATDMRCLDQLRAELGKAQVQLRDVLEQYEKLQELMQRVGVLPSPRRAAETRPNGVQDAADGPAETRAQDATGRQAGVMQASSDHS